MDDRWVQRDQPLMRPSSDVWSSAVKIAGVLGFALSILVGVRHMTTQADLDKYRLTYHEPLQARVATLERQREDLNEKMAKLSGSVDLINKQLEMFSRDQARFERQLESATTELKQLMNVLTNKLERYQIGGRLPTPQRWWDDEWHLWQRGRSRQVYVSQGE